MHLQRLFILIGIPALLTLSGGRIQSQIRTRVDLVVVPVSVRDNNGNILSGLTQADFTVSEDGKQQTIANFSVDRQRLAAAIIVDNGVNTRSLKQIVANFPGFLAQFSKDDEMVLFRYDNFVRKLSDFTNDPAEIGVRFQDVTRLAGERPDIDEPDPTLDTRPNWLRTLDSVFKTGGKGSAPPSRIPTVDRPKGAEPRSHPLHTAIYDAAMALRNRESQRRKTIFIISDGEQDDPRKAHSLDQNTDLMLQREIQVFAIATQGTLLEGPFGLLGSYATATGGDVYGGRSNTDMEIAFERIAEQAHTQYVLGYVSNNRPGARPVFRKIDVKSGVPRQGRIVTHRKGYLQYPAP